MVLGQSQGYKNMFAVGTKELVPATSQLGSPAAD